jgi:hypothetical protein
MKTDSTVLDWLIEEDLDNPSVRYFSLTRLLDEQVDSPKALQSRKQIMLSGTVPAILAHQQPDGGWVSTGASHQDTGFQVLLLAELGADPADARVHAAGQMIFRTIQSSSGGFAYQLPAIPSRVVHCHHGQMVFALARLGFQGDDRFKWAVDWQSRIITGDLLPDMRYYKSSTPAPEFVCAANQGQPCGWGAVKALRGSLEIPEKERTKETRAAILTGCKFLLKHDLLKADFPYTGQISSSWFKPAFPLSFWSDLIELAEVLVFTGLSNDPAVQGLLDWIESKREKDGRWLLKHSLNGKMWVDVEALGKPSKWVTFRAMNVLKAAGRLNS